MIERRVYVLVLLILIGGLVIDIIPMNVIHYLDTAIGRSVAFLFVAVIASLFGIPEAILYGTVVGLMINKSHDLAVNGFSIHPKDTTNIPLKPLPGNGGKVYSDKSQSYTTRVAERLGIVPLDTKHSIMENSVSYLLR